MQEKLQKTEVGIIRIIIKGIITRDDKQAKHRCNERLTVGRG